MKDKKRKLKINLNALVPFNSPINQKEDLIEKLVTNNSINNFDNSNNNSYNFKNFNNNHMIRRKQGIEFSRIINAQSIKNLEEIIKCKICYQIIVNPVDCSFCQKSFCYDCLILFTENNKNCPFGCNFSEIKFKNSSNAIKNVLSFLKFSCINLDCKNEIDYNEVLLHDEKCEFSNIKCPNIGCFEDVKKPELEKHVKFECEFYNFICNICGNKFNIREFDLHTNNCRNIFKTSISKDTDNENIKNLNSFKFDNLVSNIENNKEISSEFNNKKDNFIEDIRLTFNSQDKDNIFNLINNDTNQILKNSTNDINEKNIVKKLFNSDEKELKEYDLESDKTYNNINYSIKDQMNKNNLKGINNVNDIPLFDKIFKQMFFKIDKYNEDNNQRYLKLSHSIEKINEALEKIQENEKSILENTIIKEKISSGFINSLINNNASNNDKLKKISSYKIENFQVCTLPNGKYGKTEKDSFLENSAFINNINNFKKISKSEFNILSDRKSKNDFNKKSLTQENKYAKKNLFGNYSDEENINFREGSNFDFKINDLKSFIKNNNNKKIKSIDRKVRELDLKHITDKYETGFNNFELNNKEFSLRKIIYDEKNNKLNIPEFNIKSYVNRSEIKYEMNNSTQDNRNLKVIKMKSKLADVKNRISNPNFNEFINKDQKEEFEDNNQSKGSLEKYVIYKYYQLYLIFNFFSRIIKMK